MESLKHRKSIRKYSSKEVPSQLLTDLLEEAERTPTMGNLQLYSVIITQDKNIKALLSPAHFNQPMVQNSAYFLRRFSQNVFLGHRKASQTRL